MADNQWHNDTQDGHISSNALTKVWTKHANHIKIMFQKMHINRTIILAFSHWQHSHIIEQSADDFYYI